MKEVEPLWNQIEIAEFENSYLLIFITPREYINVLLDCLKEEIQVITIEDEISKMIYLNILFDKGESIINYATNETLAAYPNLGWINLKQVPYWTAGHNESGRGVLHMPPRRLISY